METVKDPKPMRRSMLRPLGYLIAFIVAVATYWISSGYFSGHSLEYVAEREVHWQREAESFFADRRHLHEVTVWLKKNDVRSEMSLDAKWSVRLERVQTQSPFCGPWTYSLFFDTEEDGLVTDWVVDGAGVCL